MPNLKDRDSLFISFYKQNPDSSYSFYSTFKNFLPIFLKRYYDEPVDSLTYNIYSYYAEGYPPRDLTIGTGTIELTIRLDVASSFHLKYLYYKIKDNWFLNLYEEWTDYPGEREIISPQLPDKPESIDEFSFKKYLCPE